MIEELLIALSGCPGDIFYPAPIIDEALDQTNNRSWTVAPELLEYLHPGEQELLSKLLTLSPYVASFGEFVRKYNSLAFFRQVIESTDKIYRLRTSDQSKEVRFSGDSDLPLFGSYATSLSDGFAVILKKYRSQLVELETALCDYGDFGNGDRVRPSNALQRVYSELQSYFRIFPVFDKLRAAFGDGRQLRNGGEILSFICRLYESERADQVVKSELDTILRRCVTPFRNHLMQWLSTGRTESDRFEEFFVQASKSGCSNCFVINDAYLPSFVTPALAETVLFIGKSVSVMAESTSSNGTDPEDWMKHLESLSSFLRSYASADDTTGSHSIEYDDLAFKLDKEIETIRQAAAEKLYAQCFEGTKALNALEAWVKNAFFLGKGELFLAFIDIGGSVLAGPISPDQLSAAELKLSACWKSTMEKIYWQNDEERELFEKLSPRFVFDPSSKGNVDVGWNAVHLALECPPRLTPIFTTKFVSDLNTVFRFLLRWRRTQSLIESCWAHLEKLPAQITRCLPSLDKIRQLTSLMLFVVKNLQYYLQVDVLETVYSETVKELSSSRDFEHVLKVLHIGMLDKIYAHCFLKRGNVSGDTWQSKVGKILKLFGDECDTFSGLVLTRLRAAESTDGESFSLSTSTSTENDRVFAARVHECYVNFQRKTALLFKILTTSKVHDNSACLNRLLLRLDFNDYFSSTQLFSA